MPLAGLAANYPTNDAENLSSTTNVRKGKIVELYLSAVGFMAGRVVGASGAHTVMLPCVAESPPVNESREEQEPY